MTAGPAIGAATSASGFSSLAAARFAAGPNPDGDRTASPATATSGDRSRLLGIEDIVLPGKPACKIGFVNAGYEPDGVIREEECADVSVDLVDRALLEKNDKWERLDEFDRKFIQAPPGGKVAYVEGGFTASIYPVGTDGRSYEVAVAD